MDFEREPLGIVNKNGLGIDSEQFDNAFSGRVAGEFIDGVVMEIVCADVLVEDGLYTGEREGWMR